jgi:serine phosphatase RsbU (regulator of sigma subunit)/anti-anti-sigma regulatory factor
MTEKRHTSPDQRASVLIVDDDRVLRTYVTRALREQSDLDVAEAPDGEQAKILLQSQSFDVVVTDLGMPVVDGLSLMQWAQQNHPGSAWIILSGAGTFETAVQAVRLGAYDFFSKPLDGVNQLLVSIRNALRQKQLEAEKERLTRELEDRNARLDEQVRKLREACHLLCEQADVIHEDLHRAELIQRALLPQTLPAIEGFSIHSVYRACENVGGDTYDVKRVDEDHAALCIADAAGHGVSAAMLAVLFKNRLRWFDDTTGRPIEPRAVLGSVNRDLADECRAPGLFVTAVCALLNIRTRRLTVASAGHPPLLLRRADGTVEWINPDGPALGLASNAEFAQREIDLRPGDRMLFYTDGLRDHSRDNPKAFMEQIPAILTGRNTGRDLLNRILALTADLPDKEKHQEDDITLVLLEVSDAPSSPDNGAPKPAHEIRDLLSSQSGKVLMGASPEGTVITIQGRITWTLCPALLEQCQKELALKHRLFLDMSLCSYLDSTSLGTVQEVTDLAQQGGTPLDIYGLQPNVRKLFEELEMTRVLEQSRSGALALPESMVPLAAGPTDEEQNRSRILMAHETLSSLGELNRRKFAGLVEFLKEEQQRAGETPPTSGL